MFRKKVISAATKGTTTSTTAAAAAARGSKMSASKRNKVLAAASAATMAKAAAAAQQHAGSGAPSIGKKIASAGTAAAAAAEDQHTGRSSGEAEGLNSILDVFRSAVEPMADLDETITLESKGGHKATATSSSSSSAVQPTPVSYRTFAASLTCEKKFFLMQERPDLMPKLSIGEAVHIDDAAGFNELARRWDRLQFGSKAILIKDQSFEQAAQHTEMVINNYFETTYASLGEQAPSLTIHRPAFAAPFGGSSSSSTSNSSSSSNSNGKASGNGRGQEHPLILQARPAVLRYRPKDNQWVILESQAIVDPLSTTARAAQCLQRIHFSMLAFRYWVTQPHVPISVRKRFLNIDFDGINAENRKGHRLLDSAAVTAPIDLQRSGILHVRQFFPGPVTLMDCPPPRLVKYIQRLSLEDLLEVDRRNATKHSHGSCSGAFDLQNLASPDATVFKARDALQAALQQAGRHANARSTRSLRQKDSDEHVLFEAQQHLLEALLRTHTMRLVEKARDPKQRERWTAFSENTLDGHVRSTYAHLETQLETQLEAQLGSAAAAAPKPRGKKAAAAKAAAAAAAAAAASPALESPLIPIVPCFSENLGPQCSRGDVCPFFVEGKCLPQKVSDPTQEMDNHLFTLPSTAVSRKVVWWAEGMRTLRDLLYRYKQGKVKLSAPQLRYAKAVAEGEVAINPKEIDKFFGSLRYPVFIIDFEAAQFALPPFQKVVSYQSVPFQFSLDVFQQDILTETPTHYDFLHFGKGYSPNTDPRTALTDELMHIVTLEREKRRAAMEASGELARIRQAEEEAAAAAEATAAHKRGRKPKKTPPRPTAKDGSPVEPVTPYDGCFLAHFASFEKSCLEKLGQLDERHKDAIKDFYFLDTMDLIKKGFIHPNAGGSNSLKKVLPALCPDFQYGVFGSEDESGSSGKNSKVGEKSEAAAGASAAAMDDVTGGDESSQKGENAMGVYRLWYHQEGGGTLQDLQRATAIPGVVVSGEGDKACASAAADPGLSKAARDKVWATLRIQLLEYCSLDTKALYEIMREAWKEKELVKDVPPADKTGWVFTKPTMREVSV